jgi:phage gpG-like protein
MKASEFSKVMQQKMLVAMQQSMVAVANEAVNWSKDRFQKENWIDRAPVKWQPRNPNAKRNKGRKLLYDTGTLQRSIQRFTVGAKGFEYGSAGVKYAAVHNYGLFIPKHARSETFKRNRSGSGKFKKGTTPGRGFSFKAGGLNMPQRQFLGKSFHLEGILRRKMIVEMVRRMRA